ncbi:protein-glutamine glutaminase family protein [Aquiflexum lacus]|uniref:protein-glutamine glutaminase family protein n=1 Tax=Aquiflexum lacus TaxID=2483805 RepID=UPI001894A0AD|nr:protein-glutamine glutaminase family protein [Aquiflexum lacus]
MSKRLSPLVRVSGCEIGKIWAFAPSIYTMVSDKKLTANNPLYKDEKITWGYHVAPLLAIKNGNKIDTVVIDFSIKENKYIPYKEWISKLNCPEAIYTFTDYNYYLFHTFDGLTLTGSGHNNFATPTNFPKIITGHFWYLATNDTISIPSGLAYNDLAVYITDKYYSNQNYNQYKEQLKNLTKLNEMPKLINRSISNLPAELVDDCLNFYNDRMAHWRTQDR